MGSSRGTSIGEFFKPYEHAFRSDEMIFPNLIFLQCNFAPLKTIASISIYKVKIHLYKTMHNKESILSMERNLLKESVPKID